MKLFLRKYLVWITLVMLLILLFFQVRWIIYSVRFQEKVFQNSVDLAMDKTIAHLNNDHMVCSAMRECMGCDRNTLDEQLLSKGIWNQIHATVDSELAFYNIDLEYDLYITKDNQDTLRSKPATQPDRKPVCYTQSLRELMQTGGYELVVSFPNRTRFLLGEAGLMLFSSVILILLILLSLVRMARLYIDEMRLAENIKELINNVAHEFKTPMSSIALASNLIRKGRMGENQEKLQDYGDLIYKENQKLQRQVDNLLDLAVIERGGFNYHKSPERMAGLVTEALDAVKLLVAEREAQISTQFTDEDDIFHADRMHLVNAISNLVVNALKYSANQPEISIKTKADEQNVYLEIKDNGIGIPGKYQKYIFDKFYRVPTGDVHNIKGFGLGLSYVRTVVEAHGGKVSVESDSGMGSTFTIVIPKSDLK